MNNEPIFSVLTGKGSECCTGDLLIGNLQSIGGPPSANGCYVYQGSNSWMYDPGNGEEIWVGYMDQDLCDALIIYEAINLSGGASVTLTGAPSANCCPIVGTHGGVTISCGC